MKFTVPAAFLALVGSVFAQTANFDPITSPTKGQELVADGKQSYKIVWDPTPEYNGKTVTIRLLQGATQDTLDFYTGGNIASSIDSALGSYTWNPESSIAGYATYGFKLQLDSDPTIFQYSFPFKITAGSASSTSSEMSSSVASTTSSSSSPNSPAATDTSISSTFKSANTVTAAAFASVTASIVAPTGTGSVTTTATGSGAQTTLTTAYKPSSTGSASASVTSAVVTAGAGRIMAGGLVAIGGVVAAMLTL